MLKLIVAAMLMTTTAALPVASAQDSDVECDPGSIGPWVDCMVRSAERQLWYLYWEVWDIILDNVDRICHLATGGPCWIADEGVTPAARLP